MAKIESRFTTSEYAPARTNGQGTYEAGASAMALASLDPVANRGKLGLIVSYLTRVQNANGSWDYFGRSYGDSSITQYGVLGLWESENSGVEVAPAVWERIASWYMSTQFGDGGWVYHHDQPDASGETMSMTAAGVGSLLICRRQLDRYREDARAVSPLLTSLATDATSNYKPSISFKDMDQAIARGIAWISSHWSMSPPTVGRSPYYSLYGIERIGALAERQTLGRLDWFEKGRAFIRSSQGAGGLWNGEGGPEPNTAWAILFLTKSTAKTLKRIQIQRLGGGTLLGGRGLPKDLTSMTVAGGRVVSRPMNGAIEGMLAVLEDPRAEQGDAAVAGMVDRYYRDGPNALRPYKARFRKMLTDRDPGVRRVAAWALAHTGDMDIVPALIEILTDADEDVVGTARLGLETISRKIEGLGPPRPSTPEQRKEAAARWLEWYNAIKPLDLDETDEVERRAPERGSTVGLALARPRREPEAMSVTQRTGEERKATAQASSSPPTPETTPSLEARVRGESPYDRVTSFLMATVLGAILVVGWLALVYVSNQAFASRVTPPLQIIDVGGGGGGSPEGTAGSIEKIDVAGAEAAPFASNNEEEAGDFEEPSVQQRPAR